MRTISLIVLIACAMPFSVVAQDAEIPDFIAARGYHSGEGGAIYTHPELGWSSIHSWTDRDSNESFLFIVRPYITKYETGADYLLSFSLKGDLPDSMDNAMELTRFQVEAGSDEPAEITNFDSAKGRGDALGGNFHYSMSIHPALSLPPDLGSDVEVRYFRTEVKRVGNDFETQQIEFDPNFMEFEKKIHLSCIDGVAFAFLKKMAGQTGEEIAAITIETDAGKLTLDVPPSVREPLREFLEWAEEVCKPKDLTWPSNGE